MSERVVDQEKLKELGKESDRVMPLYKAFATCLSARGRCVEDWQRDWSQRWTRVLRECEAALPHGSGFDDYPVFNEPYMPARMIFTGGYHMMNDNGEYVGWVYYIVSVRPDFVHGFDVVVKPNRSRNVKYVLELVADQFSESLRSDFALDEAILRVG